MDNLLQQLYKAFLIQQKAKSWFKCQEARPYSYANDSDIVFMDYAPVGYEFFTCFEPVGISGDWRTIQKARVN